MLCFLVSSCCDKYRCCVFLFLCVVINTDVVMCFLVSSCCDKYRCCVFLFLHVVINTDVVMLCFLVSSCCDKYRCCDVVFSCCVCIDRSNHLVRSGGADCSQDDDYGFVE